MKIKIWLIKAALVTLALFFLSLVGLFLHLILFRYPTDHELMKKFPRVSIVDTSQADIGLIEIEDTKGERGYIELVPQWVMPWQTYDWAKGGYPDDTE